MTKLTIEAVGEDDVSAVIVLMRLTTMIRDDFNESPLLREAGYDYGDVTGNASAKVEHDPARFGIEAQP